MVLSKPLFFVAGPCVIESRAFLHECADYLSHAFAKFNCPFIFKSSFCKANRTSYASFRGPGIEEGLDILSEIKQKYKIQITTDIHEPWQAELAAKVVDLIQIPARLCQQTDIIEAAAVTGRNINFKKGQFLSPHDMEFVVEKARHAALSSNHVGSEYYVTERGTFYGENRLVVDMRSFRIMGKCTKCPVVFDASHSIQLPGSLIGSSGGEIEHLQDIACAAVATGNVSGVFFEAHPNPKGSLCDGPIQLPFSLVPPFLQRITSLYESVRAVSGNGL